MSERRASARIASQTKRPAEPAPPQPEPAKKPRADAPEALAVGEALPDLTLTTDARAPIHVPADVSQAVIFTYPKANTPGCTTQGQCYRDSYAQFEQAGWKVFGLSADSPTALASWKEKQSFPYPLISDPERTLIAALTGEKSKTLRSHFAVDAQGKLVLSSISVKPKESAQSVLEFIAAAGDGQEDKAPAEGQEKQADASAPAPAPATDAPAENTKGDASSKEEAAPTVLKVGDALPSLTLTTDAETSVEVPAGVEQAVLFTYPKANTPGCTKQGQCYRDAYAQFEQAGWKVFGLSADTPAELKSWKEEQGFAYPLLSDPERSLIGPLTGEKAKTVRSHFVVDKQGKLVLSSIGVDPKESADATLSFIQAEDKKANL